MKRRLTTYLFDLDGTLIDSIGLILASYHHTMRIHRGEVPPDELWLRGLGTPIRVQLQQFSQDPEEIEAMVATYQEHNLAHHDSMVRAYPGVLDAVRALAERGEDLGIVTSKKRKGTGMGLARGGFNGLFPVIVTADDVERPKPDPEPVERALELLGVRPDEAVFVGDSPWDIRSGRAAGVATAAVAWGPFPHEELTALDPDFWVSRAEDLLALGV